MLGSYRLKNTLIIALLVSAFLAGAAAPAGGAAPGAGSRPNILVVLVDDLGFGDLSVQGAGDLETPRLDALAASGVRFTTFYANCTVCSPTRAALMTGRYPDLVGVPGVIRTHPENSWGHFRPDAATLPERLREAGYQTGMVGKWHLGLVAPNTPTGRGFDSFAGFLGDMMDDYYDHRRHGVNYMREGTATIDPEGHATDLFSGWAADFIRNQAGGAAPWFLYLAYNAPHTPIQPPDSWLARVRARAPDMPERRAKLVALIEHLDDGVGRVLDALDESGQSGDTLVVFTSDNGGQVNVGGRNGPFRGGKQDAYEGGLRVPFFAAWPGVVEPGTTSDAVAVTMDLYPTLCEIAGIDPPPGRDGVSILGALTGEVPPDPGREIVWMRREGGIRYGGQCYYAIRQGRWKLLQNTPFSPRELFDLEADPAESRDRLADEREVGATLSGSLGRHIQRAGGIPWQAADAPGPVEP